MDEAAPQADKRTADLAAVTRVLEPLRLTSDLFLIGRDENGFWAVVAHRPGIGLHGPDALEEHGSQIAAVGKVGLS